jgi:hypothetical protein
MAQFVEALCYNRKVAVSILDYVIGIFHWHIPSGRTGPVVDAASNRNEYHEYFLWGRGGRCLGLTTLPHSCTDFYEICEPSTAGTLRAHTGLYRDWSYHWSYQYYAEYWPLHKWLFSGLVCMRVFRWFIGVVLKNPLLCRSFCQWILLGSNSMEQRLALKVLNFKIAFHLAFVLLYLH